MVSSDLRHACDAICPLVFMQNPPCTLFEAVMWFHSFVYFVRGLVFFTGLEIKFWVKWQVTLSGNTKLSNGSLKCKEILI